MYTWPCGYITNFHAQLSMNVIMLINVKIQTVITFIRMINTTSKSLKARKFFIVQYFSFVSS